MSTEASSRSFYQRRAIARKILREGTGLATERMPDDALWARLSKDSYVLLQAAIEADAASPELARATFNVWACALELRVRGVQLTIEVEPERRIEVDPIERAA